MNHRNVYRFVGAAIASLLVVTLIAYNSEAAAGDGRPEWAEDLPLAAMQAAIAPSPGEMDAWRQTAESCMAGLGYEYDASLVDYDIHVDSNRYGITYVPSPADHLMESLPPGNLSEPEAERWYAALVGDSQSQIELSDESILYVSRGGCVEVADEAVFGNRISYLTAVHELQIALVQSWVAASETPTIKQLVKDWSSCMRAEGFDVTNLEDAAQLSVSDPDVIAAHQECDQQLAYTETWVMVEADVQSGLLDERPQLSTLVDAVTG